METKQRANMIAIITMKQNSVKYGNASVFIVDNKDSLQKTSSRPEKILDASAHEIDEFTMIIVAR